MGSVLAIMRFSTCFMLGQARQDYPYSVICFRGLEALKEEESNEFYLDHTLDFNVNPKVLRF